MANVNVTVIGLDKLGASFGLAVRNLANKKPAIEHQFAVIGYDEGAKVMEHALKIGAIDKSERTITAAVSRADLVILAVPFDYLDATMSEVGPALKAGAVVLDASLLKNPGITLAERTFRRNASGVPEAYLVGVSPMVNPAQLGEYRDNIEAASADLISNGVMIVSPATDCPEEAVQLVVDFTALLGVRTHFIDPAEHDAIVAAMDGLPLLVQLGVFRSLQQSRSWDDLRWMGNPAFFLATYQLGQLEAEHYGQLLHSMRGSLIHRLDALIETLKELKDALRDDDPLVIGEAAEQSVAAFLKWEKSRQTNDWMTDLQPLPKVSTFRPLGGLLDIFGKRGKS